MLKYDELENLVAENDIVVSGRIIKDENVDNLYYVFVEVTRSNNNLQIPSNKKLEEIKSALSIRNISVQFILTDGTKRDIEIGLRASLLHSYGSIIRNVFLSIDRSNASVWLVPKRRLFDDEQIAIRKTVSLFLDHFDIKLNAVRLTIDENIPTSTACLIALRQLSPTDPATLVDALRKKGFDVPSTDWISRKLDSLRKSGRVVRLKSGKYALSLFSLRALGTGKGSRSPDISRMLALSPRRE
jgi:hypothetical protein